MQLESYGQKMLLGLGDHVNSALLNSALLNGRKGQGFISQSSYSLGSDYGIIRGGG